MNEIFNRLCEYDSYDSIKYLEFHYAAYENKFDFLQFLRYEISNQENRIKNSWVLKLQSAHIWVEEKQQKFKSKREARLRKKIQSGVRKIVASQSAISPAEIDSQIKKFCNFFSNETDKLATKLDRVAHSQPEQKTSA